MPKALSLLSGGLDSILATRVVLEQGIHVEGIFFDHGCNAIPKEENTISAAELAAQQLNIPLHTVNIIETFKPILLHPKHGYGAHFNPCLDCKIFMVKTALEKMHEWGFDFLVTGEVIGQRPMSQRKQTLPIVVKESGADDRLLRPLCAKLLPPTLPESMGWIEREKLYDFSGRSRKPQIALAKQLGLKHIPQPAGGCLLTEEHFSNRLQDLLDHRETKNYNAVDLTLLKVGRHIRLNDRCKLIVSRNQWEGEILAPYKTSFVHLFVLDHPGPITLIEGEPTKPDLISAAQITARYSDAKQEQQVAVKIVYPNQRHELLEVITEKSE
ncbi:MAG: tRNA (5-methylaminomethyl-2-thiouridylate)-methyltransferase [Gammaproteobacteria bacterium]|nr:tRNA (5-methylaminomethyl-2-thiouridylate)-methyltransferase [Gammaproteobacteria bacterium]MBU1926324.1 tRNA (5-methylaminomethyl-2-thiouridylate)-methyltransferase [Gammaproteobacteria bacterium]